MCDIYSAGWVEGWGGAPFRADLNQKPRYISEMS